MRIRYFEETDTLLIEFKSAPAITVKHASQCTDIPQFSYERIAA